MPRLASHAVHLRDEYTCTEENVTQKVKALRGLCALHGIKANIIKGESGLQSRAVGHGAMAEGWWTPRIQAKQLLRHLTIDILNDMLFTSYFTCVDMTEALNGKVGDPSSYLYYGYFGEFSKNFELFQLFSPPSGKGKAARKGAWPAGMQTAAEQEEGLTRSNTPTPKVPQAEPTPAPW